jgi:adenylate cyclase
VGNLGTQSRSDYTAIGDPVNIASRLEGMNKLFGTKIIISESTYYSAGDSIITRELDLVTAKGTSVPIRIYELVAVEKDISSIQRQKINLFEQGVKKYREKRWDEAKEYFRKAESIEQGDKPSKLYIDRCENFKAQSPPEDWAGVFKFYSK